MMRLVLSLGLLAMFSACSSDGVVGDDDGVDAGIAPDADPLAPDADPFAPDADPLAPDAHQAVPPDAAVTPPPDAAVTPPPDAAVGPADAAVGPADAGFTPWASWDGIYSMAWVPTSNTCTPGLSWLTGWTCVRLADTALAGGYAIYEQACDIDWTGASWTTAHVIAPGMTIDQVVYPTEVVSSCVALQNSATTFQCVIVRHPPNDPVGPCAVTWQMTATFISP
jgi:hypothetical protein